MAFILKDRVKESTTTTGTGNISLGGALATFDTFQTYLSNGDTTFYAIAHTSSGVDEWEVGLGTWNTGNTLSRTTVLAGSNGTSAVDFSAGTKDIFMTYPASKAIVSGEDAAFANITVTGTVDGRDIAADGTKLDGVEASADVTDTANVTSAGALMRSGGTMTGNLVLNANPSAALGAATKQYVDTEVSSLVDSAPSTLDTLNELAAALGDDANFSTTVTNSIATKLPLAGGTLTGNLSMGDNVKAIFGAGSDLQIYHDGSNSYIQDVGTGGLYLKANADFYVQSQGTDETFIQAASNAFVKLFYNGSEKLATTSTGISITGNATFADNGKAIFGAGSDLQIEHDGANSYITDVGTGDLFISGSTVKIRASVPGAEDGVTVTGDGAVTLYYDNAAKLATTATGIDVTGTITADGLTVESGGNALSSTGNNVQFNRASGSSFIDQIGASGSLLFRTTPSQTSRLKIDNNGDISFYEDTGTTAKLFWDASAESLGIGTTSPDSNTRLHIKNANTAVLRIEATGADKYPGINFINDAQRYDVQIDGATDSFRIYDATNAAARIVLDTSGNVGIGGTPVPSTSGYNTATLHLRQVGSSSVGSQLRFTNGVSGHTATDGGFISYWHDNNFYLYNNEVGDFRFYTSATESMRLTSAGDLTVKGGRIFVNESDNGNTAVGITRDADEGYVQVYSAGSITTSIRGNGDSYFNGGNLLVGDTSATFNDTAKTVIRAAGDNWTIKPTVVHSFNRTGSDGDILEFYRTASTKVGSIGSNGGDALVIEGGTGSGSGFIFSNSSIIFPARNNVAVDATLDFGRSDKRFKDLYLSGSAYTPVVQGLGDEAGLTFGGALIAPRKNNAAANGTVDLGASSARFKDLHLSGAVNAATGTYTGNTSINGTLDVGTSSTRNPIRIFSNSWPEVQLFKGTTEELRIGAADSSGTYNTSQGDFYIYDPTGNSMRLIVPIGSSGSITRNNGAITVWDSGNDGSGSGLDADLLDGVHASGFVRGDGTNQSAVDIRADNTDFIVRDTGDSITNFIWRDHSANTLYLGTANAVITARSTINANSNNITNVNQLNGGTPWTSANDGSGSGLDADLLDGTQGANVIRSGGTITVNDLDGSGYPRITANGGSAQLGLFRSGSGNIGGMYIGADSARWRVYNTSFSERFGVDEYGNSHSVSSSRAPIFYDSNNTAYYVDPASTSVVNQVIATNIEFGDSTGPILSQERDQNLKLQGSSGSDVGITGYSSNGTWSLQLYGHQSGNQGFLRSNWGSWSAYADTSGNWFGTTSVRAPIFYDSDNTNYYLNPANSSATHIITTNWLGVGTTANSSGSDRLTMGGNIDMNNYEINYVHQLHFQDGVRFLDEGNDNYLRFRWNDTGGGAIKFYDGNDLLHGHVYGDGSGGFGLLDKDEHWFVYTNGTDQTQIRANNNPELYVYTSYVYAPGSFRAPIFYDSDNTAYYVNPNGTSRLNAIDFGDSAPTLSQDGVYFRITTDNGYANLGAGNTSYFHFYTDRSTFYFNKTIEVDGGGIRMYDSNADVRAYIFYDQGDTSYYVDPNSDSRISRLLVGDGSNYIRIGDEGEGANTSYSRIRTNSSGDLFLDAKGSQNIYLGWWSSPASRVFSEMGAQFPVYYDRNNTAYYFDGSATGDSIRVAGNIVAYYSDERLKDIEGNIDSPLEKVSQLNGFYYTANKKAQTLGYKDNRQVGVSAQEVEAVMPEVVTDAAIGHGYKTVDYAKLVPLLIEAVKEQQDQIETLKSRLEKLEN